MCRVIALLWALGFTSFSTLVWAQASEDGAVCRCLGSLSELEDADESARREAEQILREYCEEDLPLEQLSGSRKAIAEMSCAWVQEAFVLERQLAEELEQEERPRRWELFLRLDSSFRQGVTTTQEYERARMQATIELRLILQLFAQ